MFATLNDLLEQARQPHVYNLTPPARTPLADSGWIPSPLYRMTVEQYEAMVASGASARRTGSIFINGYLVAKMTQNPRHRGRGRALRAELARIVPRIGTMSGGQAVRLPGRTTSRTRSLCGPGDDSRLREAASRPGRYRPGRRGRGLQPGGRSPRWRPRSMDRPESRSTGLSTWSTPGRGLHRAIAEGYTAEVFAQGEFVPVVMEDQRLGQIRRRPASSATGNI